MIRFPLLLAGMLLAGAVAELGAQFPAQGPRQPGDTSGNAPLRGSPPPLGTNIAATVRAALFSENAAEQSRALQYLVKRNKKDVIPAFIAVLRHAPDKDGRLLDALQRLSGAKIPRDWNAWMEWQEEHSEIRPYREFVSLKEDLLGRIDNNFRSFLYQGVRHKIRIEEIVWGGVKKDGIPALVNAKQIPAGEATYVTDGELVFGVSINGDSRAYPLRILNWHEMFNDVVGGVPVSLAYCTLCGSGILFDTRVDGRRKPFVFGSSGLLYRSNKLMYDTQTKSLWNQFTGRPVVGKLARSDIELKILPVVITSWQDWLAAHPDTTVLSLDTGFDRDYRPGQAYSEYFASPDLMFPVVIRDHRLAPKDRIFVLRDGANEMAWALSLFKGGAVIHDRVGPRDVVLIGHAETETVRAYESGGRTFAAADDNASQVASEGAPWNITEAALTGPGGESLARLPGHVAYWFAWQSYKAGKPARVE
jgi:hypothetical protein